MKNEVKIDPITIIGKSNKKLPNVNTALGRKQAKFYRDRILNGEMSFDAVPKNYRGAVQNYLKSVPIENKVRERHGYEGLNNFMYSVSGGVPGLVIDYINKIIGSGITTLKGNSKNIFDSSNKGIAEIITDNFREKHPTVSNVIDVGLNTIPGILLSKYIPDTTIGSTNLNSTDIKIDKSGLKRAYFTQRRNDTPFVKAILKKANKSSVKFINTTNLSLEDIENMFNINLDIHANTTKHRGKGEYLFSLGNRYGGFINNINNRRKYNFGGIRSTHDATADYLGMARNSGNRFFGNGIIDMLYHGGTNDDTGIPVKNYVDKLIANDKLIYANMQNKINNEVLTSRGITAKFGGLVGTPRRKFYWGGTSINDPGSVQWGTRVQASDIDESKYSADGEGIVGGSALSGAGTGLGIGAAVGGTAALATGAAAGSWLGPIGAGIGALIGGIVGLFTGRKKKRQEERRRQELLAEQAEMERQQTLGNMQDKVENDVATIRQSNLGNYSEGTGFYAKLGGMIGRRKLNTGGQIVPNSSNSVVAYGQTHEQYNPATGETGIIYGDSEIEGGGAKNGRMYAGEVVRETPEGGQVFSDTIKVPGTNRTFADYAKKLTDMKGKKEAQVIQLADRVTLSLSALDKSKTNKLQTGTNVRNIEKLVYRMNKARGESEAIDAKTEDLFEAQELYATALGLRNDAPVMRCGGMVRKKRPFGGYASPYSLTGVSAPKLTTLPPIQTTASAGGGSAFKFGFNEFGLGMNLASSLFGIVGNALNTRANRKAIEFESTLHVPKGNKVDAVQYSTDYDISEELQELGTQERRAARYITDNTSNVQTARNSIANLAINAQLARNKLYGAKKDYQRQRYDLNRQERINARNANNQIMYQDAINEYNKAVGLNQQLMAVRTQGLQGMLQGIEGLAGAVNNYASARLYEKLWPRGVTNHMRNGFACGGLARRKRA